MTSVDHMIPLQPIIVPQVAGEITHTILWESNVFVNNFSDDLYAHLMRENLSKEILQAKEYYDHLATTHGTRV